jgi:hypothetical protein
MIHRQAYLAAGLISLFLISAPARADEPALVQGVVTVDGEPLKQGAILIFTDDDHFVGAKVKDGKYAKITLPPGTYKVAFHGNGVPERFRSEKSGLQASVKSGENSFDFALSK